MRVTLDRDRCFGHALCNAAAPELFEMDDTGHCLPLAAEVPAELETAAKQGVNACPERALRIDD